MIKTEQIHIRISPEMKSKLQALAEKENRTISNYIETLLQSEVKRLSGNDFLLYTKKE